MVLLRWPGPLPVVFVGCTILLFASAIRYITRHPLPIGWDEPIYINQVLLDRDTLVDRGPLVFAKEQMRTETWRPPAYRLAAAPVVLLMGKGPPPPILRLLALGSLGLTALVLLLAGREMAGPVGGVVWAAAFTMAVGPFQADVLFGTELPLYPALAGTTLAVARWFRRGVADGRTCAILFLSTAVGALSKLSFLVVFLPFILTAIALAPRTRGWLKSRLPVGLALGLGLLVVSPWWLYNGAEAVRYASYASEFIGHDYPWANSAARDLLGWPLTVGFLASAGWALTRSRELGRASDRAARNLTIVCLAGCIPLAALHVMGDNHNMRLLTPAWMMAAGLIPLVLHLGGHLGRPLLQAGLALGMVAQAVPLASRFWQRVEAQRDWNPLRELTRLRGVSNPRIVQLGVGPGFNPPQVKYAWTSYGEPASTSVLWRWASGPIDWTRVRRRVDSADVVLTPVDVVGRQVDKENQHNQSLARRLLNQPGVWTADTLYFAGSGGPTVLVFVRRLPRATS